MNFIFKTFKIFIIGIIIILFLLYVLLFFYVCIDDLITKIKMNKIKRMSEKQYYDLVLEKISKIFKIENIENDIIKFNNGFLSKYKICYR